MINICRWFYLGIYNLLTLIPRYFYIGLVCLINPQKGKQLRYKDKPLIPMMMLGLTLSVYFICIFISSRYYVQRLKLDHLATDIIESTKVIEKQLETVNKEPVSNEKYIPTQTEEYANISYMSTDLTELKSKNSDTVAWLKVNNTNVNYVVVQTTDNEYYLKHDFNKNYNINGWVYGDYRDDFEYFGTNTIMYAHNMTNRTMFGSLVWVLKDSWYLNQDNLYIKLSTLTSNTVWKIFSIYQIKPEVYYLKTYFENDNEHSEFLNTLKSRSIYDFGESLNTSDKILTLSTCSDDGTKRVVIHAKMIKAEYK